LRLFLDNNLPPRIARSLHELVAPDGQEVVHLRAKFPERAADIDWIGALGAEGDWIIISGDRHILTRPHEREALRASKLTAFLLAKGWIQAGFWDQAWLLTRWLPKVVDLANHYPRGAIFLLPHQQKPTDLRPR
jgi:hypothetical protein